MTLQNEFLAIDDVATAQEAGLYGPDVAWTIGSLIQNQASYAELDASEQSQIATRLAELAVGSQVEHDIPSTAEGLGLSRLVASDAQMRSLLNNPHSSIKPVPRAVLSAVYDDGGSLISPDTLAIAHKFALSMTSFNQVLRLNDSQPALRINTNHADRGVRMDYALTQPFAGMFSETGKTIELDCSCGLPHDALLPRLILPVVPESIEALVASDGNFRIQTDKPRNTSLDLVHEQSSDLWPVEKRVPAIDLPTGNQAGAQRNVDYAHYDQADEQVSVEGPRLTAGDSQVPLVVGELSVRHALLKYDRLTGGLDDAELHRAIIIHVAARLNLSLHQRASS